MSVGGILNVALDPLFIFGLHMNVAGAALATCISNVVSVLYLLGHIIRTRKESAV
jgi:Na+-driven multidrug efflux pump